MDTGGGRSEIHKQLVVNNGQLSPELLPSVYSFSVNTYKKIIISLDSLYAWDLGGTSVEDEIPERCL